MSARPNTGRRAGRRWHMTETLQGERTRRQDLASDSPPTTPLHACVHISSPGASSTTIQVAPCNPQDARRRAHATNQLQRQLQSNVLPHCMFARLQLLAHMHQVAPPLEWPMILSIPPPGNPHIIYSLARVHPSPIDPPPALFDVLETCCDDYKLHTCSQWQAVVCWEITGQPPAYRTTYPSQVYNT